MKNQKLTLLILLTIVTVSASIPFAHATNYNIGDQTVIASHSHILADEMLYANLSTAPLLPATGYLITGHASLACNGAGVNLVKMVVLNSSQQIIAVSDEVTLNSFTQTWVEFSFSYEEITGGSVYYTGVISNQSMAVYAGNDLTGYYDTTNSFTTPEDPSGGSSGLYPCFYITITDVGEGTPEPTLPPGVDSDTELLYDNLVDFFVPIFVMILPALLLWWLGGRGKWPLLIGLAIGTGLGYVFIAGFPLWLVFLVAIGIIGMAYSDISGGGAYT